MLLQQHVKIMMRFLKQIHILISIGVRHYVALISYKKHKLQPIFFFFLSPLLPSLSLSLKIRKIRVWRLFSGVEYSCMCSILNVKRNCVAELYMLNNTHLSYKSVEKTCRILYKIFRIF